MSTQPVRQREYEVYPQIKMGLPMTPEDHRILIRSSRVCRTAWSFGAVENRRPEADALLVVDLVIESDARALRTAQ